MRSYLNNYDFYIFPIVNPDGQWNHAAPAPGHL